MCDRLSWFDIKRNVKFQRCRLSIGGVIAARNPFYCLFLFLFYQFSVEYAIFKGDNQVIIILFFLVEFEM